MNKLSWVLGAGGALAILAVTLLHQITRAKLKAARADLASVTQLNAQLQNTITALRKQQEVTRETLKQIQAAQSKADAAVDNVINADIDDLLEFMRN